MALLTKHSTANALLSLLSNTAVQTRRNFAPKSTPEIPSGEIPWAVRWWNADGCASVYVPELGAVMGETLPLDRTELTASQEDEVGKLKPKDWYNATRAQSSVDDEERIYAIFTRATPDAALKVNLLSATETPDEANYENLVTIVHLATITHVDGDFPSTVVAQLVVGALSFGAPEPHFDYPWRVKYSENDTSWVIYIPDGSVVNEPSLNISGLTAASDTGWYRIGSGNSSADTATETDVYAVLTRDDDSPLTVAVTYTTSRPENDEALAIVHVAHLTVTVDAENPDAPPVRTVAQRVVGALSFGGASTPVTPFVASFVVRKRTVESVDRYDQPTTTDVWEIFAPQWSLPTCTLFPEGYNDDWNPLPDNLIGGTLYASLYHKPAAGEGSSATEEVTFLQLSATPPVASAGETYHTVKIGTFSGSDFIQTHIGVLHTSPKKAGTSAASMTVGKPRIIKETVADNSTSGSHDEYYQVAYFAEVVIDADGVLSLSERTDLPYAYKVDLIFHQTEHAAGVV